MENVDTEIAAALGRHADPGLAPGVAAGCARYVRSRQCPDGGFCFYRAWGVEDSNAADTFEAVACFHLLAAEVPRRRELVEWLQNLQDSDGGFRTPIRAWYVLEALRLLGARPQDPRSYLRERLGRLELWGERHLSWSAALRDQARIVALCARHDVPIRPAERDVIAANLRSLRASGGGYGLSQSDLVATAYCVATLGLLQLQSDGSAVRAFLHRCEDSDQGFRIVPASSVGSLDVTRAGLWLAAHLRADLAPSTVEAARRSALSCRSGNGGFGRTTGAIPTLEDTRLALEILLDPRVERRTSGGAGEPA